MTETPKNLENENRRRLFALIDLAKKIATYPGDTAEERVKFWNDSTTGEDWTFDEFMTPEDYAFLTDLVRRLD